MKPMKKVLVLGDVMLDCWQVVDPHRISSEAPVLISRHVQDRTSPGGAANAAVNCAHLGARVMLIGAVGKDPEAEDLFKGLMAADVHFQLFPSETWPTIEKLRIVDQMGRQMLRIDTEGLPSEIGPRAHREMWAMVEGSQDHDVLFISDYGKGTLNSTLTVEAIRLFADKFILVNGKPDRLDRYAGADVLVFNRLEALTCLGMGEKNGAAAHTLAEAVWQRASGKIAYVIVTDGAKGLGIYSSTVSGTVQAPEVRVADVAGAGDTICATIAARGLIDAVVLEEAVANAAKVVSQHGTAVPL